MAKTVLVVVSGPPGSGKTTLGRMIAGRFGLPFLNKDGIKEPLGEVFGAGDIEWSRKLGLASYEVLYAVCERLLEAGMSHVIESNFRPGPATERLLALKAKYAYEPFEIHSTARDDVILSRYQARDESGERHPVHVSSIRIEELARALESRLYGPLGLGGFEVTVDTTDFTAVDYESLYSSVATALGRE